MEQQSYVVPAPFVPIDLFRAIQLNQPVGTISPREICE